MQELNVEKITFNEVVDDWLSFKKNMVKESTFLNYTFIINKRLRPELGEKTLEDFQNYNINAYINSLKDSLVNKTIRDILAVLKSILRYAERKYDKDFKLDLISAPLSSQREIEVFDEKEKSKLEKYLLKTQEIKYLGVLISLYAGLRIGEVCALKWSDIDFDEKLIHVSHTLQRVYVGNHNTKVIFTLPKTKKSIRRIPISRVLFDKLKEFSKGYQKNTFILSRKRR